MKIGIILIILGVVCLFTNIFLIRYFLKKRVPELLDINEKFPDDSFAWENTAGTGIVPKWVSFIGLISIVLITVGIFIIIISFFM